VGGVFLQHGVFGLHLPLPDNVSKPIKRFATVNADVLVLPDSITRTLALDPPLKQSIEFDWINPLEEGFEKRTKSYRK